MKTTLYHKVKRAAALILMGGAITTGAMAQETLHLFYKNGKQEKVAITPDTKVEFYKRPYANIFYDTDTIHMSASSGRTFGLGHAEYNVDWNITTADEWLLTRKGNSPWELGDGMLQDYFVVYATANATDQRRVGKVTVTSARAGLTKDIVVVQHPYMLTLDYKHMYSNYETAVIAKSVEIAWKDTTFYANVYPNHGVKVLSHPDWMTLKYISEGDDYCQFEDILKMESAQSAGTSSSSYACFTFAQNEASTDRVGNIIFEGHGQTAVLTVTQKGLTEEVIVEEAEELVDESSSQYGQNVGTGTHSDFGFPALMLSMESRGADLVSWDIDYNWFSGEMRYLDMGSNLRYTAMHWTSMYTQINNSNEVIRAYGERSEQSLFQFYLGQAYALRAFNYFYLAQLYQQTYVGNEEALCVPIITEANMKTVNTEGCERATVREVYDFILSDLEMALDMLQKTTVARPGKDLVSPEVVYGLRARVYMVMNQWAKAFDDASMVINTSGAVPYTREEVSKPTFADINHNAWIWGINQEETDQTVTSAICNWPSHMGSFSYGYAQVGAWRMVNRALYASIPTTDVRKGWFLDEEATSANLNAEQANYVNSYAMLPYTQVKFAPYMNELGTRTNASDIPLMRIEEMYLIAAEAQAMMGDAAAGAATLQEFVTTYRDPAYTCKATTAEEVREAVWMQRRIELWGEGHSYFDLMRMKKGVDRRGAGFQTEYVYHIPAGDAALIYPIPDREMSRNPLLIQNPVAEQPVPVSE